MAQSQGDTKPRVAVFGAGLVGCKHVELVSDHAVLDAIVDPAEASVGLAEKFGCPRFDSPEAYLSLHAPDGVIIATPNQLHVSHGLSCIRKGIPILVEKPIADTPARAADLVREAEAHAVPILVGHHRRYNPIIRAAKQAITEGRIGKLVSVHAQFWLRKPEAYYDQAWRRAEGAGPVFINLIHDIDLLRHLCGEITRVQAVQSSATRGFEVEDSAAAVLAFENGALGTVSVSDAIPAPWSWELSAGENPAYPKTDASCYRLGGTKGSLSIPDMKLWHHPGEQSWWAPIETDSLTTDAADPLVSQLQHFLAVIDGREAPYVSGAEGLRSLQVINAIKEAAQSGKACEIQDLMS